jgi:tetratricopeptide (TPR) repeat protein
MKPPRSAQPRGAFAEALNEQASARVLRGIALLNENRPESLRAAVREFEAAIEARRNLPFEDNPWFLYAHIAGWLNRGDALTRLGGTHLNEAVRSYNKALRLLRDLPRDEHPLFRRRHAIAWQNRGLTLLCQSGDPALAEALRSFDEAISVLADPRSAAIEDRNLLLAATWLNRGNALLRSTPTSSAPDVREAAHNACLLVSDMERANATAAEISLKGRHIQCQAIAHLLARPGLAAAACTELLDEASDAVDAGMQLARHWEQAGANQFRELVRELFRFGARVYQVHQPHFLVEFLLETLYPEKSTATHSSDREMHAAAGEALWRALRGLQKEGFSQIGSAGFEKVLALLGELRVAEETLAHLRRRC